MSERQAGGISVPQGCGRVSLGGRAAKVGGTDRDPGLEEPAGVYADDFHLSGGKRPGVLRVRALVHPFVVVESGEFVQAVISATGSD